MWMAAVIGFGTGMYFAGQAHLLRQFIPALREKTAQTPVKKPSVTKPPDLSSKMQDSAPPSAPSVRYTFFETLDDPEMVSYVDLKGAVVHRSSSQGTAPAPVSAAAPRKKPETGGGPERLPDQARSQTMKPSVPVPPKPQAAAARPPVSKPESAIAMLESLSPSGETHSFWVQVSSFQAQDRAQTLLGFLREKGFAAFVARVEVAGKGTWYRVYLGKFADRKEAERVSEKAKTRHGLSPVIVPAG